MKEFLYQAGFKEDTDIFSSPLHQIKKFGHNDRFIIKITSQGFMTKPNDDDWVLELRLSGPIPFYSFRSNGGAFSCIEDAYKYAVGLTEAIEAYESKVKDSSDV